MNSIFATKARCSIWLNAATVMVAALSLSSCDKLKKDVLPEAQALTSSADMLHSDFFQQRATMAKNIPTDAPQYNSFLLDVQSQVNQFRKDLSACKEQEDADELFKKADIDSIRAKNDQQKDTLAEAIAGSSTATGIKNFQGRCKHLQQEKGANYQAMMEILDEKGEDYCEDTQEEIKACHKEIDARIKSITTGLSGFDSMLKGAGTTGEKIHSDVEALCKNMENAYAEWAPPPPPPSRPEQILFTVETTPALYEALLSTMLQQYKQFSYSYTAPDGARCIADKDNKIGFVIRLVNPTEFDSTLDDLDQCSADLIFAFRDTFPDDIYTKIEERAAAQEDDLNAVLVSGVAYNAVMLKVTQDSPTTKLTSGQIGKELQGKTLMTGGDDSLSGELFNALLKPRGCSAQTADKPEKQLTSDNIIAVAFSRKIDETKALTIARTPSEVKEIYFHPIPGNIASGRYPLSTPVNAVLNPASSGNAEARAFLEYALSDAGQTVVKASDFVSRNEYEETNPEILQLRKMFDKAGYTISRIVTYDTFLFPKNDTTISKNPQLQNSKKDFREFDSAIRSNFGHMGQVLKNTKSDKGIIAVGIIGHASSEGGEAINKPLSLNRAKYTGNCIKNCDKESRRLILTDGMSSAVPVDDNKTEEGKVRNRRCTAYVVEVFETGAK